jgi:hypothetical protein
VPKPARRSRGKAETKAGDVAEKAPEEEKTTDGS